MYHNQRVFQTLIEEVGVWSNQNFGFNVSKWPRREDILLDHTAPLLGIIEECGELAEAFKDMNKELIRDSIGDTLIYLADYLFRLALEADIINWKVIPIGFPPSWFFSRDNLILVGQLAHINLKRHQGIRGYDGPRFLDELAPHLTRLLIELSKVYKLSHLKPRNETDRLASDVWTPQEALDAIIVIGASTWKHVQQRNWKSNPQTGGA